MANYWKDWSSNLHVRRLCEGITQPAKTVPRNLRKSGFDKIDQSSAVIRTELL
jgi:hypothetical protein